MSAFKGFPAGKVSLTPIPGPFFHELLPGMDHLGELKVILYAFWRLDHMEGAFRYLRRLDFSTDSSFMAGLGDASGSAEAALDEALQRAVGRGVLLQARIKLANNEDCYYFLNSPKGRAAVQAIERGSWQGVESEQLPVELIVEPPNIYRLYEENFGPLTPMIADALRDAEDTYPILWIEEAIRIAVENNKRSLRYVLAILNRWQTQGRDERKDRPDSEKDRSRYAEWEG